MSLAAHVVVLCRHFATASRYEWSEEELLACGFSADVVAAVLPLAERLAKMAADYDDDLRRQWEAADEILRRSR